MGSVLNARTRETSLLDDAFVEGGSFCEMSCSFSVRLRNLDFLSCLHFPDRIADSKDLVLVANTEAGVDECIDGLCKMKVLRYEHLVEAAAVLPASSRRLPSMQHHFTSHVPNTGPDLSSRSVPRFILESLDPSKLDQTTFPILQPLHDDAIR